MVGILLDYSAEPSAVKVKFSDFTGQVEVVYFNSSENTVHPQLATFDFSQKEKPVALFAAVRVFKNKFSLAGISIKNVTAVDIYFHKQEVMLVYFYHKGKIQGISSVVR